MILNDGTFLYSSRTIIEYLTSLGFDIKELMQILNDEIDDISWKDKYTLLQDEFNAYEIECERTRMQSEELAEEIHSLGYKLSVGKPVATKREIGNRLLEMTKEIL